MFPTSKPTASEAAGASGYFLSHARSARNVCLCPFRDEAEAHSGDGQFCSDLRTPRDYKVTALKEAQRSRNPRFARAKEKYENQHERQDQGQLPRNEGHHQGGGRKGYE